MRPNRGEGGYAMIVTVIVISILTMLLVVVLAKSLHNNQISTRGARRSAALGVAEGGVHSAIAALQANRSTAVGERDVNFPDGSRARVKVLAGTPKPGFYTILSTGQIATPNSPTRTLQVVMGPPASFSYAIYANQALTIDNNACIVGTVFAKGDIRFEANSTIAGTSQARGWLIAENGQILDFTGANSAKCPDTVDGQPVDTSHDIHGDVLAGGASPPCRPAPAGVVPSGNGFNLNNATVQGQVCNTRVTAAMPTYTFDPGNYTGVQFFGRPPGQGSPSMTAAAAGSAKLATDSSAGGLSGAYVIWQDPLGGAGPLNLNLGRIRVAADTVIYTNVPVSFGNNTEVEPVGSCSTQDQPPAGTPLCPTFQVITTSNATPAINGQNGVDFRKVAVLLYSPNGTIELMNSCNGPQCNESNLGSFYGEAVTAKNNLNVSYTPRIAYALGFGRTQFQQVSWQELAPCPAGQTPPC